MAPQSQFKQLRVSLNAALDAFEEESERCQLPTLDLNSTKLHPFDDAGYLSSPKLWESRKIIIATLGMMRALLTCGTDKMIEFSMQHAEASCVEVVTKAKVVDVLAADDVDQKKGLHKKEIGKRCGIDGDKLARLLRLLTTNHIFRETSPDTFANNRLSILFKSDHPCAAFIRALDSSFIPTTSKLWETLSDPDWGFSYSPRKTAFNRYFGSELFFDYLARHPQDMTDFALGIEAYHGPTDPGTLADYPWGELGEKTVVDVGGGKGSFSLKLLKAYPNLKLILQDRPEVVEVGKMHFSNNFPEAIEKNRVKFEPYDFRTQEQPNKGDEFVFFMRAIAHDWPDDEFIPILKKLRPAMGPKSKLILCEFVVNHGMEGAFDPKDVAKAFAATDPNAYSPIPWPAPLAAHGGEYSKEGLLFFFSVMTYFNSLERTKAQFDTVLTKAGFKLNKIWPIRSPKMSLIEATIA